MGISVFFSIGIYQLTTIELNRAERMQRPRLLEAHFALAPLPIEEIKHRIKVSLIITNLVILGGSAALAWLLSGKTLKPIKEMVDEQNRFISDASHELKTPLTALKAEIEVNLRDKRMSLGQAQKLLRSNLEEVNKLQKLSENLLELSQPEKLKLETVDLKSVSEEAVRKIKFLAAKKQIKIENKIKGKVKGNKEALIELLVILLDNAVKYSPQKSSIFLSAAKTNNNLTVAVKDQGVGISEKDLPHIFDRFYRVDKARSKNQSSGYGLGLAIAKKIMDQHNGVIKAESKINQGTNFKLVFSL